MATDSDSDVTRPATIEVPVSALLDVLAWWRSANEGPGGCSTWDAIQGMSDSVWILKQVASQAGHHL